MAFLDNLDWRYATKKFDETRPIPSEDLEKILEAIRLSPSSYGQQPYHITVVTDKKIKEKLTKAALNQQQVLTASHVLVFSARTDLLRRKETFIGMMQDINPEYAKLLGKLLLVNWFQKAFSKKAWAEKQTGIALGFALAAAAELKIDSCPMEGFSGFLVKHILQLPHYMKPTVLMPIGYRATDQKIYPKVRFSKEDLFDYK